MSAAARILVVEDEASMRAGLEYALAKEGYDVQCVADGEAALEAVARRAPDLVLLDVMLPKRSGFEVLAKLRTDRPELAVILLTAKAQEIDKVHGFDLGADDYVTKPFSLAELLARVRARLRGRTTSLPAAFDLGSTRIDLERGSVERDGAQQELSQREVEMLRLLLREQGRAVSRERFLSEVWGHARFPTTRTVDQHVVKLRQKIEVDPASPRHLLTAFGKGYRLEL